MIQVHQCLDCAAPLFHKPGKGSWPKRCPECKRRATNAAQNAKHKAAVASRPHVAPPCIEDGCESASLPGRRQCETHRVCVIFGCFNVKADGRLCATHKKAARRERLAGQVCSIDGCDRPLWYATKAVCQYHGDSRPPREFVNTPERAARMRDYTLRKKFGITSDDFDQMLKHQRGKCAICKSPDPKAANWHVDHDHVTSQIRGLLCRACNTGIGLLQDDPKVIDAALNYVRKHRQMVLA